LGARIIARSDQPTWKGQLTRPGKRRRADFVVDTSKGPTCVRLDVSGKIEKADGCVRPRRHPSHCLAGVRADLGATPTWGPRRPGGHKAFGSARPAVAILATCLCCQPQRQIVPSNGLIHTPVDNAQIGLTTLLRNASPPWTERMVAFTAAPTA
jgi:hypothetical protein